MHTDGFKRKGLVFQAEQIEKALSALELPARIQGGQVGEGKIRYYLAPITNSQLHRLQQMANRVAEEIGIYQIQVTESEGSLVLDLPMAEGGGNRLLPLLMGIEEPSELVSVIGIDDKGTPFGIDFRNPESQHLLIVGGSASGKSEFLRTVIFSIALFNRQTQVNFLGIDLSGNELSVIEALPHCLAEIASESQYAIELMQWFIDEIERREVFRIRYPELFLFIDDLDILVEGDPIHLKLLQKIIEEGKECSVHVVASSRSEAPSIHSFMSQGFGVMKAEAMRDSGQDLSGPPSSGKFSIYMQGFAYRVRVAWMPLHDLQDAVSFIQSGKKSKGWKNSWVRWF